MASRFIFQQRHFISTFSCSTMLFTSPPGCVNNLEMSTSELNQKIPAFGSFLLFSISQKATGIILSPTISFAYCMYTIHNSV